jgi:lipopolysaccharide export system protein LptC
LPAVSDIGVRRSRVPAAGGRGDDERIFRAAVRHSRFVRRLRIAVPLAMVLGVLAAVAVASLVKPLRVFAKLPVDIGNIVVSGTKVKMQQPRIAGFTNDKRAYELTAQAAAQDLTKPNEVELQGIQARMEMQDKSVVDTTAKAGVFDTKTEKLMLQHNILVSSSSGLKARLDEATIEVRNGRVVSEKPVEVSTPTLIINSNRMEIADSGNFMRFEKGVTVTLVGENDATRMVSKAGRP